NYGRFTERNKVLLNLHQYFRTGSESMVIGLVLHVTKLLNSVIGSANLGFYAVSIHPGYALAYFQRVVGNTHAEPVRIQVIIVIRIRDIASRSHAKRSVNI